MQKQQKQLHDTGQHGKQNENLNADEDRLTDESDLSNTSYKNNYAADAYKTEKTPAPSHTPVAGNLHNQDKPVVGRIRKKGSACSSE